MRRPLLLLPIALAVGACGGPGSVSGDEVAAQAEDALEAKVGTRPDITCPGDLAARVGARLRCALTAGEDPAEYAVDVTVTSVQDGEAEFDFVVDDTSSG